MMMLKRISRIDIVMMGLAMLSLVVSEVMYFQGDKQEALFIGLWVPSILGFAIYLKLLTIQKK